MSEDDRLTYSDIDHYRPSSRPTVYLTDEQHLSRKFDSGQRVQGEEVMRSIRKEKEGMVRLFDAVKEDVDDRTRRMLLDAIDDELDTLDRLEDQVMSRLVERDT